MRYKQKKIRIIISFLLSTSILLTLLLVGWVILDSAPSVPPFIIYEGLLLDNDSTPITHPVDFRLSLWNSDDWTPDVMKENGSLNNSLPSYGGWQEEQRITPSQDGIVEIFIGSHAPLPIFQYKKHRYFQIEIKKINEPSTQYILLDPSGDHGNDRHDRQVIGSMPYVLENR